ncbi:MAG: caspase family protein [Alphaproteobacteria bacterium]
MRFLITKAVILILAAFGLSTPAHMAQAETRKALIVANYDYGEFGTLNTPQNDGRLMEKTLLNLGFEVKRQNNLDRRDLKNELTNFIKAARLADVALIYYSGYQVSLDDKTYLTPVGEVPTSVNLAQLSMVSLEALMQRFSVSASQNVLIVEGGWKSPFADKLAKLVDKNAVDYLGSTIADLSAYNLGGGEGRLITISASSAGKVNPSETGVVSKFTDVLSDEIGRKGVNLSSAFSSTVAEVSARLDQSADEASKTSKTSKTSETSETSKASVFGPAVYGSLSQSVYLAGAPLVVPLSSDLNVEAELKWREVRDSNIGEEIELFLKDYANSRFGGIALEKLHKLNRIDPAKRKEMRDATLEYRELSKQLIAEKQKFDAINTEFSKDRIAIKPVLSKFNISGNVSVRHQPEPDGEWLGLYSDGDVVEVRGAVVGTRWLQVRLKERKDRKTKYGYIYGKAATPDPRSDYAVWRSIQDNPSNDGYQAYLTAFPKGYNRYDAVKALMKSKFPDVDLGVEDVTTAITPVDIKGLLLSADEVPQSSATIAPSLSDEPASGNRRELIREMGFYLDVMEEEYVTTREARLRRLPWVKTRVIANVKQDEKIVVTGRVRKEDWYRVKWGGGRDLYVKGSSIEPFANSELAIWQDSKGSGEMSDFSFYLQRFPAGRFAEEAKASIASIKASQKTVVQAVVQPIVSAREFSVPTNVLELINVQPVAYDGSIQHSLSSALMQKFGRSLKLRVSNDKNAPERTFIDVKARIIDVKIDELVGSQNTEQRYMVAVEVEASRYGEVAALSATDIQFSDFETGTLPSLAIQLTAKKALSKAADQILKIMQTN